MWHAAKRRFRVFTSFALLKVPRSSDLVHARMRSHDGEQTMGMLRVGARVASLAIPLLLGGCETPLTPTAPRPPKHVSEATFVWFGFDSAALSNAAIQTIKGVADSMRLDADRRLALHGFADSVGAQSHNEALSLRRANVVKDRLVREGIAADRITMVGMGSAEPLVSAPHGVPEPQNRRVVIFAVSVRDD